MRTIGMFIADTHGGFKLGLMNPNVVLYDRNEEGDLVPYHPRPTAVQEYFWNLLLQGVEAVVKFAHGDPIVVIHYGDATHGDKYPKTLVSTEIADQPAIAVANMEPMLSLPNVRSFRLAVGTDAHNFDDGNAERIIINDLKLRYPNIDCGMVEVGLGDIDGVDIEYAHQGAWTGARHHLKGNIAHQFLRDKMTIELMAGHTPPRLYGYGHYHEWIWVTETISVGDIDHTSTLFVIPSFNFPNMWTTAMTRGQARFTHGLVAIEVIDGKLTDYKRFTRTIDRRTKEKL
jgi:hypothetical protein